MINISKKNKNKIKIILASSIISFLIISTISSLIVLHVKHSEEIRSKIVSIGGELVNYDSVDVEESPFDSDSMRRNKIFRITYLKNGKQHIAWYRAVKNPFNIHEPSSRSLEEKWIIEE